MHESIPKIENSDNSFNKDKKIIWKLEASGAWGVNINNESQFPPFVLRAVKVCLILFYRLRFFYFK